MILLMMSVLSVLIYRFDTIIIKIQEGVSCRNLQANSKIDIEKKRCKIVKMILKDRIRRFTITNFKTQYKATMITTGM